MAGGEPGRPSRRERSAHSSPSGPAEALPEVEPWGAGVSGEAAAEEGRAGGPPSRGWSVRGGPSRLAALGSTPGLLSAGPASPGPSLASPPGAELASPPAARPAQRSPPLARTGRPGRGGEGLLLFAADLSVRGRQWSPCAGPRGRRQPRGGGLATCSAGLWQR